MSFFSRKKQENISELPELPDLPDLPEIPEKPQLPPLPAFPNDKETITNQMVKQVVNQELPEEESYSKRTMELPEEEETPRIKAYIKESKQIREIKEEPIFVRIDKYQESKENLQEVKRKILEIESLLRDINELKAREDSQLHEWDSDIQEAKAKLDKIERIMFQKM